MTVAKIAISLDPTLADEIRRAAADEGTTVSAWLADSAKVRLQTKKLREFLDDYQREHGTFTEAEMESVRQVWRESHSTPAS